jgi:hypothetical protein
MTTRALAIISGPHKGKVTDKAKRVATFVILKFLVAILKNVKETGRINFNNAYYTT